MATNLLGVPNSNIFVPYTAATKRTKQLDIGAYTTCDASGWSCNRGVAVFYADSNNVWRVLFNIRGTVTGSARTDASIAIAGIVFKNTSGYYPSVVSEAETVSAVIESSAVALLNDNKIKVIHASNSTTVYAISGDVELNTEPTWASLGTTASAALEGVLPVDVFIPSASASESGLVTTGAQTIAGVKTFNSGISLGNETLTVYDEGSFSVTFNQGMYTTGSTVTVRYVRVGNHVTLAFPDARVTANATAQNWGTASGALPSSIRPTGSARVISCPIQYSNLFETGLLSLATDGTMNIYRSQQTNFSSGTANCGFYYGTCTYLLAD